MVIRGEPTTEKAKKSTNPESVSPKTIFNSAHLPGNSDPKGTNFGIIN